MRGQRDAQGAWNTESELEFVKELGTFNLPRMVKRFSRKEWLRAYYVAIVLRDVWGKIEKEKVEKAVWDELCALEEAPCL